MKVVLLTGPSGCGKSRLTRNSGLPTLNLDDFYHAGDDTGLPQRFGIVDWDDPRSWDGAAALAAIIEIATTGTAQVPIYAIKLNRQIGIRTFSVPGFHSPHALLLAEGVFAGELVEPLKGAGLLAGAICLKRPRLLSFWFRLTRDIKEARKPIPTLIKRGIGLLRSEPALIAHWESQGCQPMSFGQAQEALASLTADG
ncbi:MAG: ATP-binding protein [Cellulomonadaceae bacterium]|nr:ATP-binding protein [Cellulomonadaceae bacterium]